MTPTDRRPARGLSRALLARRSLRHYWRAQLPTALGVALCAAVLSGALLVAAAVRATLARIAQQRLGDVEWAVELPAGRRVADSLATRADGGSVLSLSGMVVSEAADGGESIQVNNVRLLGVDSAAWRMIGGPGGSPLVDGEVQLGARLAGKLGVSEGDFVSLRVAVWSSLPRDAPLAARSEAPTARWRTRVAAVLSEEQGGRFGLEATQVAPLNAVLPLGTLQQKAQWAGRANLLVFQRDPQRLLASAWGLADLGVQWEERGGVVLLRGDAIFLDRRISAALPPHAVEGATYLVDAIERADGTLRTPYSFVMGLTPQDDARLGIVPATLAAPPDGVVITTWLAERLRVSPSDIVVLRYRRWKADGAVVAESRPCRVAKIVRMEDAAVERARMPAFPGLTDVERCADWDIGMDLDADALKDEANEAYWTTYGPTPKAFLPLPAVQAMMGDRFGTTMEARCPSGDGLGALQSALRARLDPKELGLAARPVRQLATRSARGATDFGGLFVGLSFFLIVAALLLAAMLCTLGVLRRSEELGALRAVGFSERVIRRLVLREVLWLAALASGAGAVLGMAYARGLLWALAHGWAGALADTAPTFVVSLDALLQGAGITWLICGATLAISVRRVLAVHSRGPLPAVADGSDARGMTRPRAGWRRALPWIGLLVGVGLAPWGPAGALAGGGMVLLSALLAFHRRDAYRSNDPARTPARTWHDVGRRGAALRPGRESVVMGLLACGIFMVCAVTAMRQDVTRGADLRTSATGGFEWLAELAVPCPVEALPPLEGAMLTPLRVLPGEDAGCLNLNAVSAPRVIGVPTARFAEWGVFGMTEEWRALDEIRADGDIPAWSGDRDTALWGLKATLDPVDGTRLAYRAEDDAAWTLRLVGAPPLRMTVFQGAVLVSADRLAKAFPSAGGASWLLVDGEEGSDAGLMARLQRQLARHGVDVTRTVDRLRAHYRVEATYLDMFLLLGGLGLLVATIGVGLVVLRNAEERRGETAVLAALGVRPWDRARLLWVSVARAQALGLLAGGAAAGVALWPTFRHTGANIPWVALLALVTLVGVSSLGWSLVVAWRSAARAATARLE